MSNHKSNWQNSIGSTCMFFNALLKQNKFFYVLFKYDLGQKYYAPQVRPDRGSNSRPPDHDSTLHVTETEPVIFMSTHNSAVQTFDCNQSVTFKPYGVISHSNSCSRICWLSAPTWLFHHIFKPPSCIRVTTAHSMLPKYWLAEMKCIYEVKLWLH